MKTLFDLFLNSLNFIRFIPFISTYYLYVYLLRRRIILEDRTYWCNVIFQSKDNWFAFFKLIKLKEYRSVFYYRIGMRTSKLISWLAPGQNQLYIHCNKIGKGLVIQHGHSTRIGAQRIGDNCQIWHNVTIGTNKSHSKNLPIIGNNVKICTGSIVIGNINIGDNATIGAGAIVVKDVPANSVVVGNPAHII